MNNLFLFWNTSYQIPMYLLSECICVYPLSIKWQLCYFQNVCVKKSNFHRTLLLLWSVHVGAVLPGFHWRLVWNNGKLLTQASLLNDVRRLDHCDIIASLAPRAEQSWHSKPNFISWDQHKPCVTCGLKAWISNTAGQLMSLIWYHPCDCKY